MQELFTNPAFQAAVAPFFAALVLTLVLSRFWPAGVGVAVISGLLVAVALTTGISFQPLTSTRKIILCSLGLPFLMLLIHYLPARILAARLRVVLAAGLLLAAMLWIIWPVLMRKEGAEVWQMVVPLGLFGLTSMLLVPTLERQELSTKISAMLALALGTGATTMIAASALYSQLAFAIAAGFGAVTLFVLISKGKGSTVFNAFLLYATSIPLVFLAASSTVYAQLPVLVLLCLVAIPVLACVFGWLPIKRPKNVWWDLIVNGLWVSIPLIPAIWLVWESAGPPSY